MFAAGWTPVRLFDGERGHVRRPGKSEGTSGTIGMVTSREHGWPLLYAFTTNGHPFEANKSYDRFGVFARLKHRGDFQAALVQVGGTLLSAVVSPITTIAVTLLYFDLRVRKEGLDLDQLAQQTSPGPAPA